MLSGEIMAQLVALAALEQANREARGALYGVLDHWPGIILNGLNPLVALHSLNADRGCFGLQADIDAMNLMEGYWNRSPSAAGVNGPLDSFRGLFNLMKQRPAINRSFVE
jgi:hypothetical protein